MIFVGQRSSLQPHHGNRSFHCSCEHQHLAEKSRKCSGEEVQVPVLFAGVQSQRAQIQA